MARLISPPVGLGVVALEPLSGPRTVGAAQTQTIGGYLQTVASPFGLWRWRVSFNAMHEALFRRYRGWVTALHGGANATRWTFFDPDNLSFRDAGVDATNFEAATGRPWANGKPWQNEENWMTSRPAVAVAAAGAVGDTIVSLADEWWGHRLDVGDYLGFIPFHLGMYMVTEVQEPGRYRIWPSLRRDITVDDLATLSPSLAMRLEGEDAASAGRTLVVADNNAVTLVEVLDYDVRDYFAD